MCPFIHSGEIKIKSPCSTLTGFLNESDLLTEKDMLE